MRALMTIAELPEVAAGVERTRAATEKLRWHPVFRRLGDGLRAEAQVHCAHGAAVAAGVNLPVSRVREFSVGVAEPVDAAERLALGALRGYRLPVDAQRWRVAPRQVVALCHQAVGAGWLPEADLGLARSFGEPPHDGAWGFSARWSDAAAGTPTAVGPTAPGQAAVGPTMDAQRVAALWQLMAVGHEVPALVVAGLVWAEFLTTQPLVSANELVSQLAFRAMVVGRGLDPMAALVVEQPLVRQRSRAAELLSGYVSGEPDAVAAWLSWCADLIVAGCAYSGELADAVMAGSFARLP